MSRRMVPERSALSASTALWIDDINTARMSRHAPGMRHGQRRPGRCAGPSMRVISNATLREFARRLPDARVTLQQWRQHMESRPFRNAAALENDFARVARIGDDVIFDMWSCQCRIVARIDFRRQLCYVRDILPHARPTVPDAIRGRGAHALPFHSTGCFEHPESIRTLADSSEHERALEAIDLLVDAGAMGDEQHPAYEMFGRLFNAVHRYEQMHVSF